MNLKWDYQHVNKKKQWSFVPLGRNQKITQFCQKMSQQKRVCHPRPAERKRRGYFRQIYKVTVLFLLTLTPCLLSVCQRQAALFILVERGVNVGRGGLNLPCFVWFWPCFVFVLVCLFLWVLVRESFVFSWVPSRSLELRVVVSIIHLSAWAIQDPSSC